MSELFLGVVVGCAAPVMGIYWFGRWILGPIDRAARARRAPIRFTIGDFLCLFVAVQLPLTLVSRLKSEETEVFFWLFTIIVWVVASIIWLACATALSRAGITSSKHRLLFMGLVLPVVYYGLIPFVVLAVVAFFMLFDGRASELLQPWWIVPIWFLTGMALITSGLYTHWLIRQTDADANWSAGNSERNHAGCG